MYSIYRYIDLYSNFNLISTRKHTGQVAKGQGILLLTDHPIEIETNQNIEVVTWAYYGIELVTWELFTHLNYS